MPDLCHIAGRPDSSVGQKGKSRMYTYIVKSHSRGPLTVQANSSTQAKRIACKMYGLNPSDYWCGVSCFSARRVKEATV